MRPKSRGKTPKRGQRGGSGGGSLGPALRMAGATAAAAPVVGSSQILSYVLMIVILGLIVWILYLIRGTFMGGGAGAGRSGRRDGFMPISSTGSTTLLTEPAESGIVTVSAPPAVPLVTMAGPNGRHDPFQDPYEPPLKQDGMYFPTDSSDVRGVPLLGPIVAFLNEPVEPARCNSAFCNSPKNPNGIFGSLSSLAPDSSVAIQYGPNRRAAAAGWPVNMQSRGSAPEFSQIGILTYDRAGSGENALNDNMILPLFGRRIMNGRDKYQYYTMSNTGAVNTKLPVTVKNRNCIGEYGCDSLSSGDTVMVQGYNKKFTATVYDSGLFSYIPFLN